MTTFVRPRPAPTPETLATPGPTPRPSTFTAFTAFTATLAALWTLVLLAVPPAAVAQDTLDLSLERALDLARANSPSFLRMVNDRRTADWEVRSAWASLAPSASVNGGVSWQGAGEQRFGSLTAAQLGFADQPSYYFSNYSVGLSQQLDAATILRPGSAKASQALTEAQIRGARVDLERTVTDAYLEVLRQEEEVALAERELERARFNLRLAEGRRDVGQVTVVDVQQAGVQVGRAEVGLLQAGQRLRTARRELVRLMGLSLDTTIRPTTTFELVEPSWEEEALLAEAMTANPGLRVDERSLDVTEHDVRTAKGRYLPSLSLSAGFSGFTREPSSTDFLIRQAQAQVASQVAQCQSTNELFSRLADPLPPQDCTRFVFTDQDRRRILESNTAFPFDFTRQPPTASLSVSIPVFQGLGRQRDVEAAQVAEEDARQQLREQRLLVEAQVLTGLDLLRTQYESALIEQRNQELATEQLRVAQEQYGVGLISFLDLLDAETVKAEADQALIAAIYGYHDFITDLEALVGRRLRSTGPS